MLNSIEPAENLQHNILLIDYMLVFYSLGHALPVVWLTHDHRWHQPVGHIALTISVSTALAMIGICLDCILGSPM